MDLLKSVWNRFEQGRQETPAPAVTAVIVAAGRGERMGTAFSKQFFPLCNIPALARTLSAFEECRSISRVIIVTRAEDIVAVADIVHEFGFDKVAKIVRGGQTRQQSCAAGLFAAGETAYLAFHDGARPLVTAACIDRVVAAAMETKAAAAGVRVKDTVKQVDENGVVIATPDRASLWAVQTPQVFETALYRAAMEKAQSEEADYTDDCQLIENYGEKVRLVEGEYTNIKLTTKDDVAIVEAILRMRGEA